MQTFLQMLKKNTPDYYSMIQRNGKNARMVTVAHTTTTLLHKSHNGQDQTLKMIKQVSKQGQVLKQAKGIRLSLMTLIKTLKIGRSVREKEM